MRSACVNARLLARICTCAGSGTGIGPLRWLRGQSMIRGPSRRTWLNEGWDASERPGAAGYLDRDGVASWSADLSHAPTWGCGRAGCAAKNNGCLELTDGTFLCRRSRTLRPGTMPCGW